ncbi:MAG: MBL fold metallo-hydrolase [Rhodothermales bacterium]|nr:MBL fold metallo-hydrolase [Rhodothermales bacterium]MBO6779396.1 MBL fold metallo-hydrolase [Rhodothermales bacterium]
MSVTQKKRRRWPRRLLIGLAILAAPILILMVDAWSALGSPPEGERLERISQSPQFRDGQFQNLLPLLADGVSFNTMKEFFFGGSEHRQPDQPIPVQPVAEAADDSLRVTWLGHSTLIVELEGTRILVDPVWGPRASPSRYVGSKRFYDSPLPLEDLPPIDAVVISHDHYDHLDLPTVRELAGRIERWIVPLGIGSHLESWGIAPDAIEELDWWDELPVGDIRLVSTPARHFSGRSVTDRNATLWTGWAFIGARHRIWYSGDTSLTPEFLEIGDRLGPFDLTMVEVGAYNKAWADVHLGPEQAVQAHQMVRGGLMLPVHWGLFDLALHGWTEPAERVRAAAGAAGISVAFPRPGESVTLDDYSSEVWWPELPWQNAEEAPNVSTGVSELTTTRGL